MGLFSSNDKDKAEEKAIASENRRDRPLSEWESDLTHARKYEDMSHNDWSTINDEHAKALKEHQKLEDELADVKRRHEASQLNLNNLSAKLKVKQEERDRRRGETSKIQQMIDKLKGTVKGTSQEEEEAKRAHETGVTDKDHHFGRDAAVGAGALGAAGVGKHEYDRHHNRDPVTGAHTGTGTVGDRGLTGTTHTGTGLTSDPAHKDHHLGRDAAVGAGALGAGALGKHEYDSRHNKDGVSGTHVPGTGTHIGGTHVPGTGQHVSGGGLTGERGTGTGFTSDPAHKDHHLGRDAAVGAGALGAGALGKHEYDSRHNKDGVSGTHVPGTGTHIGGTHVPGTGQHVSGTGLTGERGFTSDPAHKDHHLGRDAAVGAGALGAGALGKHAYDSHHNNDGLTGTHAPGVGGTYAPGTGERISGTGLTGDHTNKDHHLGRDAALGAGALGAGALGKHEYDQNRNRDGLTGTHVPGTGVGGTHIPGTTGTGVGGAHVPGTGSNVPGTGLTGERAAGTGLTGDRNDHHFGRDAAIGAGALGAGALGKHAYDQHHNRDIAGGPGVGTTQPGDVSHLGTGSHPTHSSIGSTGTGLTGDNTNRDHHLGRDAAIGAGTLGAAGLGKHEYDKHNDPTGNTGTGALGGNDPVSSRMHTGSNVPGVNNSGLTSDRNDRNVLGDQHKDHHLGLDAALGASALGAGALGKHEYDQHHNRDGSSLTGDRTRGTGVTGSNIPGSNIPGVAGDRNIAGDRHNDHHLGRDAAAGAGALGAAGLGKHEYDKHHNHEAAGRTSIGSAGSGGHPRADAPAGAEEWASDIKGYDPKNPMRGHDNFGQDDPNFEGKLKGQFNDGTSNVAPGTVGAGTTTGTGATTGKDHHLGRDAAVGAGAVGAGALGKHEYDKRHDGTGVSGTHVPGTGSHVPGTGTHIPGTGEHVSGTGVTGTNKDHHLGRDAAMGAGAVGAGVLGKHEYDKRHDGTGVSGTHVPGTGSHVPGTGTHIPGTGEHVGSGLTGTNRNQNIGQDAAVGTEAVGAGLLGTHEYDKRQSADTGLSGKHIPGTGTHVAGVHVPGTGEHVSSTGMTGNTGITGDRSGVPGLNNNNNLGGTHHDHNLGRDAAIGAGALGAGALGKHEYDKHQTTGTGIGGTHVPGTGTHIAGAHVPGTGEHIGSTDRNLGRDATMGTGALGSTGTGVGGTHIPGTGSYVAGTHIPGTGQHTGTGNLTGTGHQDHHLGRDAAAGGGALGAAGLAKHEYDKHEAKKEVETFHDASDFSAPSSRMAGTNTAATGATGGLATGALGDNGLNTNRAHPTLSSSDMAQPLSGTTGTGIGGANVEAARLFGNGTPPAASAAQAMSGRTKESGMPGYFNSNMPGSYNSGMQTPPAAA